MSDGTPALDVVQCMLTVLFALVSLHALRHGLRSPGAGRRDRVDHLLHFVMAVSMAAMPWSPVGSLSGRTTAVLFTAAALWFPLTALHHRSADTMSALVRRLPPAVGMAAMAWMLRTPHGGAVASHDSPAGAVTTLLTVCLLACALRSLTRPMPSLRSATDAAHRAAAQHTYGHVRDGAMALGTAVMLLMSH